MTNAERAISRSICLGSPVIVKYSFETYYDLRSVCLEFVGKSDCVVFYGMEGDEKNGGVAWRVQMQGEESE